jgi:ubiquitin-protein ligase
MYKYFYVNFFYLNLKIILYIKLMTEKSISKSTIQRLISDIKEVYKSNLSKDNIYYKHDDINMLIGYALIIGPKNTPYQYGNFLFKFKFPQDYPHSPPIVTYHTNDGCTRFHPNLYKNSKICLSLLNTWKGEQWTGCQTIKSILLVLCSILDAKPLIHEPGIQETHKDFNSYNKIIAYKTIDIAIAKILSKDNLPEEFEIFMNIIIENYINNYHNIKSNLINNLINNDNEIISTGIYSLSIKTHYKRLIHLLDSYYIKLTTKI